MGIRREGEARSAGWSGERGGSGATWDMEMEGVEGDHATLTASPWGTQESGARGLQVDVRAGRRDGGKVSSATVDKAGAQGRL